MHLACQLENAYTQLKIWNQAAYSATLSNLDKIKLIIFIGALLDLFTRTVLTALLLVNIRSRLLLSFRPYLDDSVHGEMEQRLFLGTLGLPKDS